MWSCRIFIPTLSRVDMGFYKSCWLTRQIDRSKTMIPAGLRALLERAASLFRRQTLLREGPVVFGNKRKYQEKANTQLPTKLSTPSEASGGGHGWITSASRGCLEAPSQNFYSADSTSFAAEVVSYKPCQGNP